MPLQKFERYQEVKASVVAIASRVWSNPEFPDIVGTGFVARAAGLILTNEHVVQAALRLPRHKEWKPSEWPAVVLYLHMIPGKGMAVVELPVLGIGTLKGTPPPGAYLYGDETPDLGFIQVQATALPALKVADRFSLDEGCEVMVAGFPMGTATLRAPGWIHQLSPTLQSALVSCVLPFRCDDPHAIMLDVMIQGGSSGSPVFDPFNGEVVGVVYGNLFEDKAMRGDGALLYRNSTSHTLAIPANLIQRALQAADTNHDFKGVTAGAPTLADIIANSEMVIHPPKTPSPRIRPLGPDDVQ